MSDYTLACAIAHYIFFNGTKFETDCVYVVLYSEIIAEYGVTEKWLDTYYDAIVSELEWHEGVIDVNFNESEIWFDECTNEKGFNVNFGSAYCGENIESEDY